MKIIIDTNILISAILKNRIPEEVIFYVMQQPQHQWLASNAIITEYKEVLRRPKFKLPIALLQSWFSVFDDAINLVEVNNTVNFERDPKDAKFLACALTTHADIFISGDKDFSEAKQLIKDTEIISVLEFFNRFIK